MDSHFTYLLIDLLSVAGPVALSFDKKVAFFKKWPILFKGITLTGLFFIAWDILFTYKGVWSFSPVYTLGINVFNLPIEEVLFFLVVPYACLFIYACVKGYQLNWIPNSAGRTMVLLHTLLLVIVTLLNTDKLYTCYTGAFTTVALLYAYIVHPPNLSQFYLSYFISLVPFLIVNGFLTKLPVVIYNNTENLGIRIGSIPIEDTQYGFLLMFLTFLIMQHKKSN